MKRVSFGRLFFAGVDIREKRMIELNHIIKMISERRDRDVGCRKMGKSI
jgi:hypothetical protein